MPWGTIVGIVCQLLDLLLKDKTRRDQLKLQMYEFAKKFDKSAIDQNEKLRDEYKRMVDALNKEPEIAKNYDHGSPNGA